MQKSYRAPNPGDNRQWFVIDAKDQILGRLAVVIANKLRAKDLPTFDPSVDAGAFVIVVNASKVKLTGDAEHKKNYYNVSMYNGGLRTRSSGVMTREFPEEMVERAVWGMIPKGRLGRQIYKKLFVYKDGKHEQEAQKPVVLDLKK